MNMLTKYIAWTMILIPVVVMIILLWIALPWPVLVAIGLAASFCVGQFLLAYDHYL